MKPVATIGYEKTNPEEFLASLKAAGVDVLVDIRDVPFSHKPGFSKQPLQALMEGASLGYRHLPALGNPKAGRDAAKAGDREGFHRIYRAQMATAPAEAALEEIAGQAGARCLCLMCFERSHDDCHRGLVADRLAARGFVVHHIAPRMTTKNAPKVDAQGSFEL